MVQDILLVPDKIDAASPADEGVAGGDSSYDGRMVTSSASGSDSAASSIPTPRDHRRGPGEEAPPPRDPGSGIRS